VNLRKDHYRESVGGVSLRSPPRDSFKTKNPADPSGCAPGDGSAPGEATRSANASSVAARPRSPHRRRLERARPGLGFSPLYLSRGGSREKSLAWSLRSLFRERFKETLFETNIPTDGSDAGGLLLTAGPPGAERPSNARKRARAVLCFLIESTHGSLALLCSKQTVASVARSFAPFPRKEGHERATH